MTDSPASSSPKSPPELLPDQPRRGFIASAFAIVIGGVVGLVPVITGTLFFLDPLLRKKAKADEDKGNEGYLKAHVTLDQLKKSPVPIQVPMISSRVDKWNLYPDQPIGSVYLRMAEDGKTVLAFNVTCPHLGCAVEYRDPADHAAEFFCPCHNSAFALDGSKTNSIPPRDLDSLDVKLVKNDKGIDEVWVKYQEFRATLAKKVPV